MNQEIFDRLVTRNLEKAIEDLQVSKNYTYGGLLKLHARTFQDDGKQRLEVSEQLQSYSRVRNFNEPRDHTWGKNRDIEGYGRSLTLYSNMSEEDIGRAKVAIEICRPENMHSLPADEKVDRLSNLYRELDYLHSFGDGNSDSWIVEITPIGPTYPCKMDVSREELIDTASHLSSPDEESSRRDGRT